MEERCDLAAAERVARAAWRGMILAERIEKDLVFFPHIMAKLNFNISGILGKRLADIVEARAQPGPAPEAPKDN